ncbi:MAG: hypothetical protein Q4E65_00940 [Clostridia bacterium]|nr:hypothetical protein [Clostridia bacterium]
MSYPKRVLAGFLSLLFLFSLCLRFPHPAQAYVSEAEITAAAAQYYDACYDDSAMNAMNGGEVSEQDLIESALGLLEAAPDPKDISIWAAKTAFKCLLPGDDPNAEVLGKLSEMMQKQDELMDKLNDLNNVVVSAAVAQQINDYLKADARGLLKTYYGALRQIDTDLQSGTIDSSAAIQKRTTTLTRLIPKTENPSGSLCEFDEFVYSLGSFLTMDYVTSGLPTPKAKLFTLFDEWQKRNYKWEHQGYEARAFFQNCALSQYLTAASIDKLSLIARIQELSDGESVVLRQRLNDLNEQVALVKTTLAPLKVVARPDSERYYQLPGHETLFCAQAAQQIVPKEDDGACLKPVGGGWNIKGFRYEGLIAKTGLTINLPFWSSLIKYHADQGISLPSANLLNTLRSDYGGASLFHIFFDAGQGSFAPPASADDTWAFVTDQNGGSSMHYEANLFGADHMYIKIMDANASLQDMNVMNYHNNSVDKNGVRGDLIGIGVKSTVVPAVAASSPSNDAPSQNASYPDADYALTLASADADGADSQFRIGGCNADGFAGANLDGKPLQKGVDFTIEATESGLVLHLSEALRASLADGRHLLRVYFRDGDGEMEFHTSALSAVTGVPATGGADNGALWALALALCLLAWKKAAAYAR